MYLILIAWLYVTLMMAIAEATNPVGSVLGGIITFLLYGVLPMAIVAYLLATPQRKRKLQAKREAEQAAWEAAQRTLHVVPSQTSSSTLEHAMPQAEKHPSETEQSSADASSRRS